MIVLLRFLFWVVLLNVANYIPLSLQRVEYNEAAYSVQPMCSNSPLFKPKPSTPSHAPLTLGPKHPGLQIRREALLIKCLANFGAMRETLFTAN